MNELRLFFYYALLACNFKHSLQAYEDWHGNEYWDQWSGDHMPPLNWDFNPGPCLPPEVPECRGEPFNECFRFWIPCKWWAKAPTPYYKCCWSEGPYATVECRHPNRERLNEFNGSDHYTYCLPFVDLIDPDRTTLPRKGGRNSTTTRNFNYVKDIEEIMTKMGLKLDQVKGAKANKKNCKKKIKQHRKK